MEFELTGFAGCQAQVRRIIVCAISLILIAIFVVDASAYAQEVRPTAEQMRVINQLPPAQRAQALQALRRLQTSGSGRQFESASTSDSSQISNAGEMAPADSEVQDFRLRAQSRTRLIVEFLLHEDLDNSQIQDFEDDPVLSRLQGKQFFILDEHGILEIAGLRPIPLKGLTADAIEARLSAAPGLDVFDIFVRILDQAQFGPEALRPFGYDVFKSSNEPRAIANRFEPVLSGPVPPDYVLGPGDTINVQFYGTVSQSAELVVSRDGHINLPELGPVMAAGQRFDRFRDDLEKRVSQKLLGTQVSVALGDLRTIRVFVMGDVERPGSYVISSMSTISSALHACGGVNDIGSLRAIELKRDGQRVVRFDVYDFLLHGDSSNDQRLQDGDVIFVPPVGVTAGVAGAVRRPAVYELRGPASAEDIVELAGGLTPDAFPAAARIERINENRDRVVVAAGLNSQAGAGIALRTGDILVIPEVLDEFSDSVSLAGHVYRPGRYEWREGMRIIDLIPSPRSLKTDADINYVLIRRQGSNSTQIDVSSTSLEEAWKAPDSQANIGLEPRDTVNVFSFELGRQRTVQPLLEELKLQSNHAKPFRVVGIAGSIRAPGRYPLEKGMRVSDLIRAGGGLGESAYSQRAELTRYLVQDGERRVADVFEVDLDSVLQGNASADMELQAHDFLKVNTVPNWHSERSVRIDGEVLYPGEYRIRRGETLREVLERAGGLTETAFPDGSIFLRRSLKEREQEQIEGLIRRLETDLASQSLQSVDTAAPETLASGRALLDELRETEPVGRLVIDLKRIMSDSRRDTGVVVELRDGDRLVVPKKSQVVTVIGEVQQSTSHLHRVGLDRDDYIEMSGGTTRRADEKLIYVVRANGAVETGGKSHWFRRAKSVEIRPGDTIVVPLETDRIRPLTFWTNVSQIFYQTAIAIAAIRTFEN